MTATAPPAQLRWQVGEVSLTRVVETEDLSMQAPAMLPDATPKNVLPIQWLQPHFINEQGLLKSAIFSLLIESQGRRIVVDTCLGNDKERIVPMWNRRQGRFLEEIAAAGFPRERVQHVVCTHLHPDHVGWNTMLVDGKWLPTFPNARYAFVTRDWEYLDSRPIGPLGDFAGDSVRPVLAAGLADLVESDHRFTDEVWLESTPGHSPGHVSVRISSCGEQAVITGDLIHHPCQLARPHWCSPFDFDSRQARATRDAFIQRFSDAPVLIIGSHFAAPSAGRLVRDGEVWRLEL